MGIDTLKIGAFYFHFENPSICNIKKYQITIDDVRKTISKNIDTLVKKKNEEILNDYKKQYTREELVTLNESVGCELMDMIDIKSKQVIEHCKGMAAFKRPSLVVFLDEFPLNRVAKTDYVTLRERIQADIDNARVNGGWDAP